MEMRVGISRKRNAPIFSFDERRGACDGREHFRRVQHWPAEIQRCFHAVMGEPEVRRRRHPDLI